MLGARFIPIADLTRIASGGPCDCAASRSNALFTSRACLRATASQMAFSAALTHQRRSLAQDPSCPLPRDIWFDSVPPVSSRTERS